MNNFTDMNNEKSILAVGSLALDNLETINGNRKNLLGGSSTYFGIATSLFSPVSIVGVVGDDFPKEAWELFANKMIDVNNIEVVKGKTFQWGGRYSDDYSARETLFTELGVFESFQPKIDSSYQNPEYLFLGNIQPELQLSVSNQITSMKSIVCDTMNLWIDLSPKQLWEVISRVNIFMLNDEEALQLTKKTTILEAADHLLDSGPSVVVIKQGGNGALLSYENTKIQVPVFPIKKLIDPTGAGDSFAGGFIGHLVKNNNNDYLEAVVTGAAVASFTVSGFGIEGLLEASLDSVNGRKDVIRKSIKKL